MAHQLPKSGAVPQKSTTKGGKYMPKRGMLVGRVGLEPTTD